MKRVLYYGPSHPMVVHQSGDPARGEWKPKDKDKPRRRRRRK